jgi:hypothetical protein
MGNVEHPVEMDLTSPDPPGSCILHREPRLPPPCNQDTKIHAEDQQQRSTYDSNNGNGNDNNEEAQSLSPRSDSAWIGVPQPPTASSAAARAALLRTCCSSSVPPLLSP